MTLSNSNSMLREKISSNAPLIVQVLDDKPESVETLDVEDISEACRKAGAVALIVQSELLPKFAAEQARAIGDFPEPLPLVCECSVDVSAADLKQLRELGANAVMLSDSDVSSIKSTIELAADESLDALVVCQERSCAEVALSSDAAGIVLAYEEAQEVEGSDADSSNLVQLGAWDGREEELVRLRDAGFSGLLLLDACRGNFIGGAYLCEELINLSRSKKSRVYNMGVRTSDDVPHPSKRNPRLWAQSKRQAKEIMNDSAVSRGLEPPRQSAMVN